MRFPLAALGIFGLLAGLGAWLVQGDFSLVPRILVAGGVLLLGIYVALDPEDVWAKLTGRGALYSGNTLRHRRRGAGHPGPGQRRSARAIRPSSI